MNINTLLKNTADDLKSLKINNPRFEAELLLSFVLKKPREYILAHPEIKVTKTQADAYKRISAERLKRIPIAYITGQKSFYGLNFKVTKNTLIPRPETELMVKEVIDLLRSLPRDAKPVNIIDVGTGTGCIIISLLKTLEGISFGSLELSFSATDISKKALNIAKKNAETHKVDKKIKFFQSNLLNFLFDKKQIPLGAHFIICANLPYLTPAQIKNSPSIKYEPKLALAAGSDGLKYYSRLFKQIKKLIKISKATYSVLCEIDPGQAKKIKQLALHELPQLNFKLKKDLAGLNRLLTINLNNTKY